MRTTVRVTLRHVAPALAILIALIAFGLVVRNRREPMVAATADIVAQVNSLGGSLPPGGRASVCIPHGDATELIVLPAYCSKTQVERLLAHHTSAFRKAVFRAAQDDLVSPAFVWARQDCILCICSTRFSIGLDIKMTIIDLRSVASITLVKETCTANSFLSVRLE